MRKAKSLKAASKRGTKGTKETAQPVNKVIRISSRQRAKQPVDNTGPTALDKVSAAWLKLGVEPSDVTLLPKITPVLERAFPSGENGESGVDAALGMLRSLGGEEVVKFFKAYDELSPTDRARLPIEAFCKAANIDPRRLLELITTATFEHSNNSANLIAAVRHPVVVAAAHDYALSPDGHQDRKMLLQRTGFVPAPKNQTVIFGAGSTVNQNSNNTSNVNNGVVANQTEYHPNELNNIESRMRKIGDRYNKRMGVDESVAEEPLPVEQPDEEVFDV